MVQESEEVVECVVNVVERQTSNAEFRPRPVLRSSGAVITTMTTELETHVTEAKAEIDFSALEDMDDMLLDDLDSDEMNEDKENPENEEIKNEFNDALSKFNSQSNIVKNKMSSKDIQRSLSMGIDEQKIIRSTTDVNTPKLTKLKSVTTELDILREQLAEAHQEIEQYQNFLIQIQRDFNKNNTDMSQAKVHMSFLFASPLLRKIKDGYENVMLLDYLSEIRFIENNLKNVKFELKYNKNVATPRNFHSIVSDKPIVLHFSGHGVVNDKQSLGAEWAFNKDKGNILLLEDEHGMSEYLFESDLKTMIDMMEAQFEVVFVASCHSEFAGKVFCNAGAKHVICIRGQE